MNELLIAILLPILLTGIAYGMAELFMKIFKISHPKNSFFVYITVLLIAFSFIPLTYIAISDSSTNELTTQPNVDFPNDSLQNLSNNSISSKLIPLDTSNDEQSNTQMIPSRFILEISWYDFIVDELSNDNEPIDDQTTHQEMQSTSENKKEEPVPSSILNTLQTIPPITFISLFLFLFAIFYAAYHLFIGKKQYLKKINAYQTTDKKLIELIEHLSKELNIKIPKIYSYHGSPNAFVLGHPAVLVISDRLQHVLSKNELKTTLRHELTHIKHHDILLKALIQAVRILCFYNPFIHVIAKKIFNKRELLADASYNTSHDDKVSFMEALIKIAEYTKSLSQTEQTSIPTISLPLIEPELYQLTMTERFFSLFKQCKKKTLLTILVSIVILFANCSALFFTHSYLGTSFETDEDSKDFVHIEKQYLVEDITYTTVYQNNEQYQGKMIHKTLYNVISIPAFSENSNIREIINYLLLKYYQEYHSTSAF
ncbi:MAG: M56 family metallopeptidase [Candidatus Thermoplasmatota archaeon]|nr:M56 family metallopeptidase [Candidatus Thermoplasmatota archaeon]